MSLLKPRQNLSRLALIGAMLLFFLLVTFTLSALPALAQDEDDDTVFSEDVVTATTTVNLNLRDAPGITGTTVLTTLPEGSIVGFTGFTDITGEWVQVDAAAGPVGWVAARFLSFVPDELQVRPEALEDEEDEVAEEEVAEDEVAEEEVVEEEPVDEEPFFSPAVVTATTTVNLNLRDAPGITGTTVLTTLPEGTVVGFTGFMDDTGDWVQVDAEGAPVGWVAARFLSDVPRDLLDVAPAETIDDEAEEDEAADEDEGVVDDDEAAAEPVFSDDVVTATTIGNLNLRAGPGTEYEILATLEEGTVVGFTGFMDDTGDWVQVDAADGPTGWVAAVWLSSVPDELQVAEEFADTEEEA